MSREVITDLLDTLALLALAAGAGAGAAEWVGWFGLAIAGVVLLVGSVLATALGDKS